MCNSCECILFPLKDAMPSTQPAGRLVKDQEKSHARQNSQLVVRFLRCSHLIDMIRLMLFYVFYENFYALVDDLCIYPCDIFLYWLSPVMDRDISCIGKNFFN